MSDVDAALHPTGTADIDPHQIGGNQAYTLVVDGKSGILRFVNAGRFAAMHQQLQATDNVWVCEG